MEAIATGPVDVIVLSFEGNQFNGSILPAIQDLVAAKVISLLDLLFVFRDIDGTLGVADLSALAQAGDSDLGDLIDDIPGGLLDAEDAEEVAPGLEPGNSVALLAVENIWAIPFIDAVREAGGSVVDSARVPADVVAAVRGNVEA